MKKYFCALIFILSFQNYTFSSDALLIESYIDSLKHFKMINNETFKEKRTKLTDELRVELRSILYGPLGKRILELKDIVKPIFVEVTDPRDAFGASGLKIYYMRETTQWYQYKKDTNNLPPRSFMDQATLGTLISHEIGHTKLGRMALDLEEINSFVATRMRNGNVTFVFSRLKVNEEELRAVHFFENPYRQYIGIPLRESYYNEGDVIRYGNRL